MWVGTLEFSARGHETFLPASYRFQPCPFKPPQVQSEICSHSAQLENWPCCALCIVCSPLVRCHIRRKAWQGSLLLSLNKRLVYFHNLEMEQLFEILGGCFIKTLQSLLLCISRLGRMLRCYASKNMDICFTKELWCMSRIGRQFNWNVRLAGLSIVLERWPNLNTAALIWFKAPSR